MHCRLQLPIATASKLQARVLCRVLLLLFFAAAAAAEDSSMKIFGAKKLFLAKTPTKNQPGSATQLQYTLCMAAAAAAVHSGSRHPTRAEKPTYTMYSRSKVKTVL